MAPDAATLVRADASTATAPPPPPPAPEAPEDSTARPAAETGRISRNWALVLGMGWPVAIAIATLLEPAPANPDAPVSLVASIIGLAFTAGLVTAVATAASRRPRAPMWSALFGVFALGLVVSCPTTGHHTFGAWWIAELAVYGAMFAASIGAMRSVSR